jgi:hypothetical protein
MTLPPTPVDFVLALLKRAEEYRAAHNAHEEAMTAATAEIGLPPAVWDRARATERAMEVAKHALLHAAIGDT